MATKDQGFLDWLIEDIANTIEIRGAVEASRDENGKVDKWKATGLAMGMGHTSDNEMAILAGLLGAEGAFDDETDSSNEYHDETTLQSFASSTEGAAGTEYDQKESTNDIKSTVYTFRFFAIIAAIGMIVSLVKQSSLFAIICLCLMVLFGWCAHYYSKKNETVALQNEKDYPVSEKTHTSAKTETGKSAYEMLKHYCGTTSYTEVLKQVYEKAQRLFDESDRICGIDEPTYDPALISHIISIVFYLTVERCEADSEQKSAVFDLAVKKCSLQTDLTGKMLFSEPDNDIISSLKEFLVTTYTLIEVATHKSGLKGIDMDFTQALCSLMILLGEEIEKSFIPHEFSDNGVLTVLDTAQKAIQKVIDDRMLG